MKSIRSSEILAAVQGAAAIPTLMSGDTGLPMTVYLLTRDASPYGPRIEVSREHDPQPPLNQLVSVSISDDPKIVGGGWLPGDDLRLVRSWILLNEDVLLRYWKYAPPLPNMMAALRPLGRPRGRK